MAKNCVHRDGPGCYLYEILVDGLVRYIGKGTGNRARQHISIANGINRRRDVGQVVKTQKFYNRLCKALRAGSVVEYRIVKGGMSAPNAFAAEIQAISDVPPGQLWNELPGGQGAISELIKGLWADPVGRARYMAGLKHPDVIKRRKAVSAIQWADSDARERNRVHVTAQWTDPEFRVARIQSLKASHTPERRKKASDKAKERWSDPEFRAKQCATQKSVRGTPEQRQKQSVASKAMWAADGSKERHGRAISAAQRGSTKFKESGQNPVFREKRRQGMVVAWVKRRFNAANRDLLLGPEVQS